MPSIPPFGLNTSTQNTWPLPQTLPLRDSGGQSFNVKAYNAKGDGTTDDTTAVQNAINAAQSTQATVFFPPGTYLVGPLTVPSGIKILGSVYGSSILKLKNAIVNPTTTTYILQVSQNCIFEHIKFDGNISGNPGPAEFSTSVIYAPSGSNGVKIYKCNIQNGTHYGIFAYNSTDLIVKECNLSGHGSYAVFAFRQCHRTRIEDNYLYSLNSSAIKIHSADSVAANLNETAENPIVARNIIDYRGQTMADSNQLAIELFCPANNQTLKITATGGTYTLQVAPAGATTAAIAYNATAAQIASALNAAGIVSQATGTNPYTITVSGQFLQVNTGSLTGGSATLALAAPPIGVYGGTVSGNQIWGPTGGANTIFGISLGGDTYTKCTDNTIAGPGINIAIETANSTKPIVKGNTIDGAAIGWSCSGSTYNALFISNSLQNCTTYGSQLYGNNTGANQSDVTHAQIIGNTWIDCGTNNAKFTCIYFNQAGRHSIISNNIFSIKNSTNPIRAIDIYSANYFLTEFVSIISNVCVADPLGTSTHGIGLCQLEGSRYCLVANNTVISPSPSGANADINGIDIVEFQGAGHTIRDNFIQGAAKNYNDISSGGSANRFIGNISIVPTFNDFVLTSQDYGRDNQTYSGPYPDQNIVETSSATSLAFSATITLDTTKGTLYTLTATGNATINASSGGLTGQEIRLIIANDSGSGHIITFGTNFRSSGTLTGSTSKSATISFISDGTSFFETSRSLNL